MIRVKSKSAFCYVPGKCFHRFKLLACSPRVVVTSEATRCCRWRCTFWHMDILAVFLTVELLRTLLWQRLRLMFMGVDLLASPSLQPFISSLRVLSLIIFRSGIGHLLASASASSSSPLKLSGQERTSCLMGLVSFLVSRSETARISALPRAETFNAVASCIVQSGTENSTKLWDYGLDGTGQVIQVRFFGLS